MTITLTREEAQQVLDALEAALSDDQPYIACCKQTVETLRARLAQPEPEPVAWCIVENCRIHGLVKSKPAVMNSEKWQPLYTTPPQRKEWQGLTDDERIKVLHSGDKEGYLEYAKGIEAKLKEKNT